MSLLESILDDPEGEKADITKQGAKSTITGAQAAIDELTTGVDARNKALDEAIKKAETLRAVSREAMAGRTGKDFTIRRHEFQALEKDALDAEAEVKRLQLEARNALHEELKLKRFIATKQEIEKREKLTEDEQVMQDMYVGSADNNALMDRLRE